MDIDLDTFLVALYTIVDDLYRIHYAPHKPRRRGQRPTVSDSELLTLAVCYQWSRWSEAAFLAYVAAHWRAYFPRVLGQSSFNRRCRDLAGVLEHLVPQLARLLDAALAPYQVIDGVPVVLAHRCRGQAHRCFVDQEAGIGRGGSDHDWYFGCHLLLALSAAGVITGFLVGPAPTEGHWLAEALFCWRHAPLVQPWGPAALPPAHRNQGRYVGPTGPLWPRAGVGLASAVPYVADRGFRGQRWGQHWRQDYGAVVVTTDGVQGPEAAAARRQHAGWRQVVEQVNALLTHHLGLAAPRARTLWGLRTRIAAKLVAVNLGIWLNRLLGRPPLALATLFSW